MAALDGGGAEHRIGEALDTVDLADRAGDKVGGYSHGMRQRLGIAGALLRAPRLLLLDEPTTGLDRAGMRDMRRLTGGLADQGITVLLSSHLMGEVEELCDRVAIVRGGRKVYEGDLAELIDAAAGRYALRTTDDDRAAAIARDRHGIADVARRDDGAARRPRPARRRPPRLSLALAAEGVGIVALVPERASLEELFFRMTEEVAA